MSAVGWLSDRMSNVWKDLDNAVHDVYWQVNIATKFVPAVPWPDPNAATVPAQFINLTNLVVNERATVDVLDTSVKFNVTKTQAGDEANSHTIRTLAMNAARLLALAQDRLIFQGQKAVTALGRVILQGSPDRNGLSTSRLIIPVAPVSAGPPKKYGENTVAAVAEAYSQLEAFGYPPPDVLVLAKGQFADAGTPIPGTLVTPADSIKQFVTDGDQVRFYGTDTLPPDTGLFISLGAYLIDWVIVTPPMITFTQQGTNENYEFVVSKRSALRLKVLDPPDPAPVALLQFK